MTQFRTRGPDRESGGTAASVDVDTRGASNAQTILSKLRNVSATPPTVCSSDVVGAKSSRPARMIAVHKLERDNRQHNWRHDASECELLNRRAKLGRRIWQRISPSDRHRLPGSGPQDRSHFDGCPARRPGSWNRLNLVVLEAGEYYRDGA